MHIAKQRIHLFLSFSSGLHHPHKIQTPKHRRTRTTPNKHAKICMLSQLPQLVKRMSDETGPTDSTVLELMQQLDELNRMTMQVSAFGPIPDTEKI